MRSISIELEARGIQQERHGSGNREHGGVPSFDVAANSTIFLVKEIELSRPELAFIVPTRAMLGPGIAVLFADRLSAEQRKAVGFTLA
jgi:hypothetical protein